MTNPTVPFAKHEMFDLISAAREAHIRYKRARTELNNNNPRYEMWDIETLNERIEHYLNLESKLLSLYEAYFEV